VDEILEADDGTMWVSTTKGIAWYDGFRWNKIEVEPNHSSKRPTKISKGYNKNILVLLNEKVYIGNQHGFKQIKSNNVSIDRANSVCMLDSATILITTLNSNARMVLYREGGHTEVINTFSPGSVRKTNSNRIWYGNADGLFEFRNKDLHRIISYGFIRSISENKNGFGVISMDSPKDQIGIWEWSNSGIPKLSATEQYLSVRSLDISSNNDVIAAYETGAVRIRTNGKWSELKPVPSQMISLICLKFSKSDDLWVGTENGLYFFRNSAKKWTWWRYGFSDPRNIVMEILKTSRGDIWIGNKNGLEIHHRDGTTSTIEKINEKELGLVTGIAEDSNGHIWISSGSSFIGAYRWDGKSWKHYGFADGLKSPRIHKIRMDKKRNLWFLGMAASGVSNDSLHNEPGAFMYNGTTFLQTNHRNGLLNDRVYSFVESENGSLWFGTKKGLSRKSKNGWKHWEGKVLKNPVSLYAIDSDANNRIWFSTFTSTFGYIDTNDSIHWVWDWVADADYKQKIWDVKVDSEGTVWVATTKGLFSNKYGVWCSYDIESEFGLKELRVVLPLKDKIYVGGHGIGVGILNREKINIPVKVVISKPIAEQDRVYISWTIDAYWCEMPSDDIEVRYKLDEHNWSEWSKGRETSFLNLSDGYHRFRLQTKDIYGNIREDNFIAEFTVPPPIYKNPAFYFPVIILLSIIMYLGVKHIRSIIQHKKMINLQRIRIANDLHDEVGSNLGSISLISQRIARNETVPQDVREDLEIIRSASQETSELLRDIVWYVNPRYDNFMSLEARLREIVGRMLRHLVVNIEMTDDIRHDEKFIESRRNIILMFKEILHNIMKHSGATTVNIRCERKPESFLLVIKDNGVGFVYDETLYGNGLQSLKRRAEEVGAELKVDSAISEGTEIRIIFKTHVTTI
jgi:ligand-binding sensor domain-containing protein